MIEISKTYPPGIAELRAAYQAEIDKHLAHIAKLAARRPPAAVRQLIRMADYELAHLRGQLIALEMHAQISMLVPADHPIVAEIGKAAR